MAEAENTTQSNEPQAPIIVSATSVEPTVAEPAVASFVTEPPIKPKDSVRSKRKTPPIPVAAEETGVIDDTLSPDDVKAVITVDVYSRGERIINKKVCSFEVFFGAVESMKKSGYNTFVLLSDDAIKKVQAAYNNWCTKNDLPESRGSKTEAPKKVDTSEFALRTRLGGDLPNTSATVDPRRPQVPPQ
jgi:hypothetical protein